jgi:riboflavin synthase
MFTGIIEEIAEVVALEKEGSNLHMTLKSSITKELKIDQSVAHNGVCLTVVEINGGEYTVTAIKETLDKSNLGLLKVGSKVNMERCMKLGDRLDGHMVQGHVDQTAKCTEIKEAKGSYVFTFKHKESDNMTVEKGSVCVNGVSLTVVNSKDTSFSVAIIPYTFEHTNFHTFEVGTVVNIEYDILGKYISKQFMRDL